MEIIFLIIGLASLSRSEARPIIKNIISIIGLASLLESVWEIAYDELDKIVKSNDEQGIEWDNKALLIIDSMVRAVIQTLSVKK